jgi:hypothetical protein
MKEERDRMGVGGRDRNGWMVDILLSILCEAAQRANLRCSNSSTREGGSLLLPQTEISVNLILVHPIIIEKNLQVHNNRTVPTWPNLPAMCLMHLFC